MSSKASHDGFVKQAIPNTLPYLGVFGIASLVLLLLTYRSAFDPKTQKPICNRRVLNTYLYVFSMIAVLALSTMAFLPLTEVPPSLVLFILLAIVEFAAFVGILLVDARHVFIKNVLLLVWTILAGYFYSLLVNYTDSSILIFALVAVLLIFVVLTWFAYQFEELLLKSHERILNYLILGAVIVYIVTSLFMPFNSTFMFLLSGFLVVLITASVAFKAKEIKNKECSEVAPPDYPRDAATILIDLRVLFNLITSMVRSRRR